jgi:hypothetical protein
MREFPVLHCNRKGWTFFPAVVAICALNIGCTQWRSIDNQVFDNGRLNALAHNSNTVVAVGSVWIKASNQFDAAVWTSSNGRSWTRVPHDDATFGGPGNQNISDVIWTGTQFVAVGADTSGGDADGAVWVSVDGTTWTRVTHDETVFGGSANQAMLAVATGPSGIVAVGQTTYISDPPADFNDPAAWWSGDGITWQRMALMEPGGEAFGQRVDDVILDYPGRPDDPEIPYGLTISIAVGFDGSKPGACGYWTVWTVLDTLQSTSGFCDMTTSDFHNNPRTIDVVGGYIYVSLKVRPDLSSASEVSVISNAGGTWQNAGSLSPAETYTNVLGSGEIDGTLWLVGNAGDWDGMTGWIWKLGRESRTILEGVLESDERVVTKARDAVDFKGVPTVAGYDFIGPKAFKGVVWYRRQCRWFQWPICQPD